MMQNFYRFVTPETEPFLSEKGIAMYYCGRNNIKQSVSSGRYWRYVVPANGKQLSKKQMEKILKTMDTDLITSDDSQTVYPFVRKYLREYTEIIERQYRYEIAEHFFKTIPNKVKNAMRDAVHTENMKQVKK